jgi:single-strand DNA-binding protein
MNKVILMGRLTRDPEMRYSQGENQMAVARFTIAVDRRFKRDGDQTADFISCVAFGKTAEFFERYIKQGTKVCVEGRIQTGSYVNRDNQKVYTTDVVVENAEFAESKNAAGGNAQFQQGGYAQPQQGGYSQPQQNGYSQAPQPAPKAPVEGFMNIADDLEDEGLPFNN